MDRHWTAMDRHCTFRSVSVFLKERQALQPQIRPGMWCGRISNLRPRERRISRGQAWPRDPNRFAINGLGLCTASALSETAGVNVPFPFPPLRARPIYCLIGKCDICHRF